MAARRVELLSLVAAVVFFVGGGSGCGDPQLGASYRGEPIATITGQIQLTGSIDASQPLRLALFFSPEGANVVDPQRWVEHFGSAVEVQAPSLYAMNVFEPPGAEHMLRRTDGGDAGYAVGRILVYSDANDNRRRDLDEAFVGIAPPVGYYFLPAPLSAAETGTTLALPSGFTQALFPQPCGLVLPPPTDPASCGVPIGGRCNVDADCQGGLCLKETKTPWPAGYCIIPDPSPSGCRPTLGAYSGRPTYSLTPTAASRGFYLRSCQSDVDCLRQDDRDQGLYSCDLGLGACRPRMGGISVPVGSRFEVEPFCTGSR